MIWDVNIISVLSEIIQINIIQMPCSQYVTIDKLLQYYELLSLSYMCTLYIIRLQY